MNPAKLPEFPPTLAHMVNDQRCYADELDLAELIRDYARAAVEASQSKAEAVEFVADICGPREHKWERDGERCVNCGDKDWMGGECSGPREATKPESGGQGEAVAWLHEVTADDGEPDQALSFSRDSFPLEGVAGYRTVSVRALYTHPQPSAAVTEAMYRGMRNRLTSEVVRQFMDDPYEVARAKAEELVNEYESALTAALPQGGKP